MKLNIITIVITLLSASSILGVLAYNGSQMPQVAVKGEETEVTRREIPQTSIAQLQQVEVVNVEPAEYQAEVVGYGEIKSRYELMFVTEVSGRVEMLSRQFESGQVVKKGTTLSTINAISYQQAVTQAKADVAQAELNLLEEQRQGEQAKSEWLRSGLEGEPDSPLVLRIPQLAQVKAALKNAQLELKKAQQDVAKTVLKAPFDALIVSRDIQPGSYAQVGTQVATLYSIDEVEIEVPLSESQWSSLPLLDNEQLKKTLWPATLQSSDGNQQWQGYIGRIEQHLAKDTRQRSLVVVVKKPLQQQNSLYPGTFVKVLIKGKSIDNLWKLPASSISQQGDIWLVDKHGLLQKSPAILAFEKAGFVYVMPVDLSKTQDPVKVVKRPLSSFQEGMKVMTKVEG